MEEIAQLELCYITYFGNIVFQVGLRTEEIDSISNNVFSFIYMVSLSSNHHVTGQSQKVQYHSLPVHLLRPLGSEFSAERGLNTLLE